MPDPLRNLILLLSIFVLASYALADTWTDLTGKFSIEAKYIGVEGKSVVLVKENGQRIIVPIRRLSPQSRARAKELYESARDKEAAVRQFLEGGTTGSGNLVSVSKRSVFQPSPATTSNQWEYARTAQTYPGEAGNYVLLAGNALLTDKSGKTPDLEDPRAIRYSLQDVIINWHEVGDSAYWKLGPAIQGGTYELIAHYGAAAQCGENQFRLTIGTEEILHTVEPTNGYGDIHARSLGRVNLSSGQMPDVSLVSTVVKPDTGLLDLKAIEIVPLQTTHRWFDVVTGQWRQDIPASMRYPGKVCDQAPPAHLIKGGPKGYAVITTAAIRDHSKLLATFIQHKRKLGYNAMVVTEQDFGGGTGPQAADNIRRWLHENYQTRELLYVLLIGNPNPGHGEIPMYPFATDLKAFGESLAAGEHPHAGRPSDLPYADCSGSTLDLNSDNRVEDFEAGAGLDTVWDVLVGRIPYYGEDSQWGRYKDVDAILQKTIDYDNASPKEILARYNFEIDGMVLDGHVVEWAGFPYLTREQSHRGRLTLDHFSWQNNSFMDQYNVGFIRSGGHANPTFIESGVTSGWLAGRVPPTATCQVVSEFGGCDCSQPEHPMNMGYMHLRQGAIATVGASRSIAGVSGGGEIVRPAAFHSIRRTPLMRGISVGQAHWQGIAGGRRIPNGGSQMWTLYGDPSVVPFPQRLHPQREFALRPVHDLEHHEPLAIDPAVALHQQEYDLQNLSDRPLPWSASCDTDWVDLATPNSGTVQPGEIVTVKLSFNTRSRQLPAGMKPAVVNFRIGETSLRRRIEFVRTVPEVTHHFTFDDKSGGVFAGQRDGEFSIFDRFDVNEFENRSFTMEIEPQSILPAGSTIAAGPEFKLFVHEDQTIGLDWQPYHYGEQVWNWRFEPTAATTAGAISLRTSQPIVARKVNRLTICTNFTTDTVTLFLNGREEASVSMQHRLFLPWKTKIGHGLNAKIDNFVLQTRATTAKEEAATLAGGYPATAPLPKRMQHGVDRGVTLRWDTLESHNAIEEPTFIVYLGTSPDALSQYGTTTNREIALQQPLAPLQRYYWRVDIASANGSRQRTGSVWQFTTSNSVSRDVISKPLFADFGAWTSQWPEPGREPDGVIAFRGFGHNISQPLDPSLLEAGGYRLTFHAESHEQKPTRPMLFKLVGKDATGADVEFVSKTIELNDLSDGKVDAYFELPRSLADAKSVLCRLQLPDGDNAGQRSPYWVFGTQLHLRNNIDLSTLPNRPPRFTRQGFALPKMPAEDNSYAYQFAADVEDERSSTLRFRKLEGPDWVSVQESGRVFSYHGAPRKAIGQHRLKVEVVDDEGLTDAITVSLKVHAPGELTLPATEAILSKDTNIRFTGHLITHITHDQATATWTFTPAVTGDYEVILFAGSPDDNTANLAINGDTRKFMIGKTGSYRNMQPHKAGRFSLKKGEQTRMTLGVVERVDGLCDVSHVQLIPIIGSATN